VAHELEVDPVALRLGSDQMLSTVDAAALRFLRRDDELAEAAVGWIGVSQAALAETAARWDIRHSQHKAKVARLSQHVDEAGMRYAGTDEKSAHALESLTRRMGI
jgi:hypothetical protein